MKRLFEADVRPHSAGEWTRVEGEHYGQTDPWLAVTASRKQAIKAWLERERKR